MASVSTSSQIFLPIPAAKRHANDVEHATELLHVVRNELALPQVKQLDESRAHRALRAIQALAHGSCGDLPGATARWNARARNTHVEATLNHPFPAQVQLSASKLHPRDQFFHKHDGSLDPFVRVAALPQPNSDAAAP